MFLEHLQDGEFRFSVSHCLCSVPTRISLILKSVLTLVSQTGGANRAFGWGWGHFACRSLPWFMLSSADSSVTARWCLSCLRYHSSSNVHDKEDRDSGNVQSLWIIFSFCSVSDPLSLKFLRKHWANGSTKRGEMRTRLGKCVHEPGWFCQSFKVAVEHIIQRILWCHFYKFFFYKYEAFLSLAFASLNLPKRASDRGLFRLLHRWAGLFREDAFSFLDGRFLNSVLQFRGD